VLQPTHGADSESSGAVKLGALAVAPDSNLAAWRSRRFVVFSVEQLGAAGVSMISTRVGRADVQQLIGWLQHWLDETEGKP
jgi:hypothetical protein